MIIDYGGLPMRIVRMLDSRRRPVMSDDGTSYLFTEYSIDAVGLVNSQQDRNKGGTVGLGMSYTRGTPASPFQLRDNVEPATNPVLTDTVIRHWLSVPRRTLVITANGTEQLRSPDPGDVCDVKGGPFVECFDVMECMGDARTFIVHFQVKTYINECEDNEGIYAGLIANRWSQYHEIDQDYYLHIVTSGEAYFRWNMIQTLNINPDTLRPFIFNPIPLGFKRENIRVKGEGSGGKLTYEYEDVQKSHQFVVGNEIGATRIEANYKQILHSSGDLADSLLGAWNTFYNMEWLKNSNNVNRSVTRTNENTPTPSYRRRRTPARPPVPRGGRRP